MRRRRVLLSLAALVAAIVVVCVSPIWARQSRLSAAVGFAQQSADAQSFLRAPGVGYVQAYVRFNDDMPDDVIMAIDQEMLEGVASPLRFKGADWMALVGVQRAGGVWVTAGTPATASGTPSNERNWKIFDLKTRLLPDIWYRMRIEADFGARHFRGFTIEGGDLKRTIDLTDVMLDYPNYMPFSRSSMTYFVAAMRGRGMMRRAGTPLVYFDDVEGGIIRPDGTDHRLFFADFEKQTTVTKQPLSSPVIDLNAYRDGVWYLERDESIFTIQQVPFARSGRFVGVADANLD